MLVGGEWVAIGAEGSPLLTELRKWAPEAELLDHCSCCSFSFSHFRFIFIGRSGR